MNRILFFLLAVLCLTSCVNDPNKADANIEVRNIYVELKGIPESIAGHIFEYIKGRNDSVINSTIVYSFRDARLLPQSNLLDGTRKLQLELYPEKDSVGNPFYSYSFYISENSKWRRITNFGKTSFDQDTLVSEQFITKCLVSRLNMRMMKIIP